MLPRSIWLFLISLFLLLGNEPFARSHADDTTTTPGSSQWGLKQSPPRQKFERELLALFDTSKVGGQLGLTVWSQKGRKWLHTVRPDTPFTPASTLKLLTTSAALHYIEPNWRPQTVVRLYGLHEGKTFKGRMVVVGKGDPNISGRYYSDPLAVLRIWADSLKSLGIDTLQGAIEVDRFWFPDPLYPATWANRFKDQWFAAEISALAFNDNCALLRILPGASPGDSLVVSVQPELDFFQIDQQNAKTVTGKRRRIRYSLDPLINKVTISGTIGADAPPFEATIPVRQSQFWFEAAMREALLQSGIELVPEPTSALLPLWSELRFTTAPLASIISEINSRSHNFYAETLLRLIGAQTEGTASVANGLQAVYRFLKKSKIDSASFTLLDGSGLSLGNRVQPRAMNLLLQRMLSHPQFDLWWHSLAWPNSGSRMKGLAYPYRTRYKTGFVAGVQGLAGYITTALDDTLTVTLYINGYTSSDSKARELMDELWMRLVDHEDAERKQLHLARIAFRSISKEKDLQTKIKQLTSQWIGTPYSLLGTGEGSQGEVADEPLIQLDEMNCVTMIENALAISRAANEEEILSSLLKIRYSGLKFDFSHRNHFFVDDWIKNNEKKGVVSLLRLPGDTLWTRTMNRRYFYSLNGLDTTSIANTPSKLWVLPREKAIPYLDSLRGDEMLGIAFVGKLDWLWVTHTGLLLLNKEETPTLRHASSLRKMVADQLITDYLQEQKGVQAIILFKLL